MAILGFGFLGFYILWHREIYQEHCHGSERFDLQAYGKIESDSLTESSGLAWLGDSLFYTHNDDSDSSIYLISAKGNLKSKFTIPYPNRDWEDIARDGKGKLYMGDFGNNFQRTFFMSILIINELTKELEGFIKIMYQNERGENVAFDCEAMIWNADSLYLFTKDKWERTSWVYAIPAKAGQYSIKPKQKISLFGMVTSAALRPDAREMALLTYGKVYFFSLSNGLKKISNPDFCLAYWPIRQSEAISYWGKDSLLLGNEQGNLYLLKRK
jgi:hypothetical protein